jgi:hypothetical protein
MDRWFIRHYCLRGFISATRQTLLKYGPSVHPTVSADLRLLAVYQLPDADSDGIVGSSDSGFSCFLASLTCFFSSLFVVASMGPRYVYKDMLDNLVSLIGCVSINHQIQLKQMANGAMFAAASSSRLGRHR